MGALTEVEIFSCMSQNLRLAAEHAEFLAVSPIRGPTYAKLRENLKLVEGCCRQASAWREDTRWLDLGLTMGAAWQSSLNWLMGYKMGNLRIKYANQHLHPMFLHLGAYLREAATIADRYKNQRAPKLGMILPDVRPAPGVRHKGNYPVMLPRPSVTAGGIILPGAA